MSIETIMEVFPVLKQLKWDPHERVELVSNTMIEEVLQDIGILDFGDGIKAKVNVSLGAPAASIARSSASSPFRSSSRSGKMAPESVEKGRGVLFLASVRRAGLDRSGCDQDRHCLPAQGQPAERPRMSTSDLMEAAGFEAFEARL